MPIEPFIGELSLVAFDFAPQGWVLCNGQMMSVSQNMALFSLLGNRYGGNGQTTFALPDLRGRVPVGMGSAPNLSGDYSMGANGGVETVTLTQAQMPAHAHTMATFDSPQPAQEAPTSANNFLAGGTHYSAYAKQAGPNTFLSPQAISSAGSGQAHANMQPYLTLNWIIAIEGIFPTRQS